MDFSEEANSRIKDLANSYLTEVHSDKLTEFRQRHGCDEQKAIDWMGTVHELIGERGKKGAIEAGLDRSLVEVAHLYMGDENSALNFVYSSWAQCACRTKNWPTTSPGNSLLNASGWLSNESADRAAVMFR